MANFGDGEGCDRSGVQSQLSIGTPTLGRSSSHQHVLGLSYRAFSVMAYPCHCGLPSPPVLVGRVIFLADIFRVNAHGGLRSRQRIRAAGSRVLRLRGRAADVRS